MKRKIGVIVLAIILVLVFAACAEHTSLYPGPSATAVPKLSSAGRTF